MKRIKQSLSAKVFLGFAGILIAVSLIIFGVLQYFMPKLLKQDLSTSFYEGLDTLIAELQQTPPEDAWPLLTAFSVNYGADVSLSNDEGVEIYKISSQVDYLTEERFGAYTAMYAQGIAISYDYLHDGKTYFLVAAVTFQAVDLLSQMFLRIFPYILALIVVLSALAAFFYTRQIARPIVAISRTSQRMAELDLSWRSETKRSDEIGLLSRNLNTMAQRLEGALSDLQQVNIKLQQDIEQEREQEKQRGDFFTAISHELKTPITVVKYDLEGMIHNVGRYRDRDKYLGHAYGVIGELEMLVQEIIDVSRASAEQFSLNRETANVSALVSACCADYRALAEYRRITIEEDIAPDVLADIDAGYMRKAVSNLLSNAVNHTPEGERVKVRLLSGRLEIVNTGVAIPPEEIERIFLPFHRVDKSRSRHTGGSGLGLYLVKTILDAHGFTLQVQNLQNAVCFMVEFSSAKDK